MHELVLFLKYISQCHYEYQYSVGYKRDAYSWSVYLNKIRLLPISLLFTSTQAFKGSGDIRDGSVGPRIVPLNAYKMG